MAIGQRKVTLEEFLSWPEQEPPLELFNGVVRRKMSATVPHSALQMEIASRIQEQARPGRLGRVYCELRTSGGANSPIPDVSFYRRERLPLAPPRRPPAYPSELPDLVVEIGSPGQTRRSLTERCSWFVQMGVAIALLIWPNDESVTLFRAGAAPATLQGDDRITLEEVLPGFVLTVRELFAAAYGA
jgi:Uma2 family endonuclease